MANSVIIKCYTKVQEEYTATAVAIRPGMLLELTSAGLVQAHSVAGGDVAPPMFAFENELEGGGIDTLYGVSSKVQVLVPRSGDIINAVLADGEVITVGELLESNGAGALRSHVVGSAGEVEYPACVVGSAVTALDLSGSANLTATGRIQVRIR